MTWRGFLLGSEDRAGNNKLARPYLGFRLIFWWLERADADARGLIVHLSSFLHQHSCLPYKNWYKSEIQVNNAELFTFLCKSMLCYLRILGRESHLIVWCWCHVYKWFTPDNPVCKKYLFVRLEIMQTELWVLSYTDYPSTRNGFKYYLVELFFLISWCTTAQPLANL